MRPVHAFARFVWDFVVGGPLLTNQEWAKAAMYYAASRKRASTMSPTILSMIRDSPGNSEMLASPCGLVAQGCWLFDLDRATRLGTVPRRA